MFKNVKLIFIGAAAALAVLAVSTVSLSIILSREKNENALLREELAQIMKERKKLSLEVDELKLIKGDLESKVTGLEAQAKILSENYDKEKSQNDVVRAELRKKEKELAEAGRKLDALADDKEALQGMLDQEKAKYDELKERVNKLVEVKGVLEEKVRDIINKQGIELERIVVNAEGELEGKVMVVNRKYNFIVSNIGKEDEVEIGDFLTVYRNGKFVGEAQVEKIYDTMSAATIVKEVKPSAIMVDDNVIVRRN